MEKKWFAALLMVAVLVCACWTGAVAEDEERETLQRIIDEIRARNVVEEG